ncbi:hypothetical protein JP0095_00320 [Helicobacter pylori]|nr:hypothetical protein JP0072_00320 [Helicobacter pylori]GHR28351.1 hypothetical protein JP0095_00320 [Helicobacter pylori]
MKALVFKNGEQDKKTRLFFTTCINKNQIMFLDYSSNATNKLPNLTEKLLVECQSFSLLTNMAKLIFISCTPL